MKVAIAGYGVEGKASFKYWRNVMHDEVTILEEHEMTAYQLPYGSRAFTGKHALADLDEFDMVVRTAGLNPHKLKAAKKVWSATNEFFEKCPAKIIGVTGTKGKGTTASLIASILKASGKTVHLVGNIGVPALEVLPDIQETDIVVYELSSFQLWDVKKSPHVAVVLMIEPDHLDVHKNMAEYVEAKANIVKFQSAKDVVVYNLNNKLSSQIAKESNGEKIGYPDPDTVQMYGRYLKLPGHHNVDNMAAAVSATSHFVNNPTHIQEGIAAFTGLEHRLKFVREVGGVKFYDDSIATTPGSAIAALNSFVEPKTIILGGSDKGGDYEVIVKACKEHGATVIAIGATGPKIAKLCKKRKVTVYEVTEKDMSTVVKTAYDVAAGNGVVMLSPASASFDMFKSYSDRGDQFVTAVEAL